MTEVQLIEACKQKQSFAQRYLYDRYVDKLFILCLRYVSNKADAEEILSDTFIKCFKNIDQFNYNGEGSTRAWLSRIAVNECLMFLRKKKQLLISLEEHSTIHEIPDDNYLFPNLNVAAIISNIHKLPPGYRTVFNLFVFEERSHKEIAETLNITESTSKTQLFKARNMLKEMLQIQEHIKVSKGVK